MYTYVHTHVPMYTHGMYIAQTRNRGLTRLDTAKTADAIYRIQNHKQTLEIYVNKDSVNSFSHRLTKLRPVDVDKFCFKSLDMPTQGDGVLQTLT